MYATKQYKFESKNNACLGALLNVPIEEPLEADNVEGGQVEPPSSQA